MGRHATDAVYDEGFLTSSDAIEEAGVTMRQLSHWRRHGYVGPTKRGHGSGDYDRWSDEDIDRLRQLGELVRLGLYAHRAAALIDQPALRAELAGLLAELDREET